MEETRSPWPSAIKYGAIMGLAGIIISLVFYLMSPDAIDTSKSWPQTIILWIVYIALLVVAANERKKQDLGGYMTYGQSLGFMTLTAIPFSVIMCIYIYIFFAVIDPGMMAKIAEKQQEALAAQDLSDDQIDTQMRMMEKFNNPLMYCVFGTLANFFQLFIIALIASIFTKKQPESTGFDQ